ncbi:hypothetical protein KJ980_03605, partial [Patescibacteria group bacterium]|nr:hypothetical protein [Patescibacteria group bacterium]
MSNFDKIEFNKKALDMSTKKRKNNRKKLSTKLIVSIIVIIIAIGLAVGFPAYATYNSGLKTYREARILLDAVKKQDIELASQELIKTKK